MAKKLEKQATRLVRKAENRALAIKLVVREYRDATQSPEPADGLQQSEKHRKIERAVARYNEVNKALRRIRSKIQLKTKGIRGPAVRTVGRR